MEDLAREHGVSKHTIYVWKLKYGGMEVSEAQEVTHLRGGHAHRQRVFGSRDAGNSIDFR